MVNKKKPFFVFVSYTEELLIDFIEYRRDFQQRCVSTVKKEIAFILDCLLALHKAGNLEVIFKVGLIAFDFSGELNFLYGL